MSDNKKIKDKEESKTSGGSGQPTYMDGTCKNCHKYFSRVDFISEGSGCGSGAYWICPKCGHKN